MSIREWVPGAQVGELVLAQRLGAGAMGVVFLATHPETGGRYAVKALPQTASKLLLDRFQREGRAQAAVDDHPNVLRVRSSGQALGCLYLVMDVASGGDLEGRLRQGPLPPLEAAALAAQLARGLEHVHRKGVLHRDLKPSNVLFDQEGVPKLVDFGIARLRGEDSLTKTGDVVGTPAYMSPEQVDGRQAAIDERADVYGLGALLYHCLTGQPPFQGSAIALMNQVLNQDPVRPRDHSPDVPPDLERVCLKAMSKSPERRYVSAGRMAADLERVVRGEPLEQPARSRVPLALALAGLVLLLLVAAAVVYVAPKSDGPNPDPQTDPAPVGPASPSSLVLRPEPPVRTTRSTIELEGTTRGRPVAIELSFGEGSLNLDLRGREFAATVPLQEGPNEISLTPIGKDGSRGESVHVSVTYVPAPAGLGLNDAGELVNEKDGSIMIRIPHGTFTMGNDKGDGRPGSRPEVAFDGPFYTPHRVVLTRAYYLGKYEVTWMQYLRFCEDTGRYPPKRVITSEAGRFEPPDDHPVVDVSWEDAQAYCRWAGLRLPSEAEWEWAARGADARRYPWGDDLFRSGSLGSDGDELPRIGNMSQYVPGYNDHFPFTAPVGSFEDGKSPFGLYDMAGNVWEWVEDYYAPFSGVPLTDPVVQDPHPRVGLLRAMRGGEWDRGANHVRAYGRWGSKQKEGNKRIGFRVARSAE